MNDLTVTDLPPLRASMARLGLMVAEVDVDLRYVWVENAQPGLDPHAMVGRRDDELVAAPQAAPLMRMKYDALREEEPVTRVLELKTVAGVRHFAMSAYPFRNERGQVAGLFMLGFEAFRRATQSGQQAA